MYCDTNFAFEKKLYINDMSAFLFEAAELTRLLIPKKIMHADTCHNVKTSLDLLIAGEAKMINSFGYMQ